MSEDRYNGWTNYETWNVKLWLDNDGGSFAQEATRETMERADETGFDAGSAINVLAATLQGQHDEYLAEIATDLPGTFGDLLTHALGCVNWYEIAEAYIRDYEPEE